MSCSDEAELRVAETLIKAGNVYGLKFKFMGSFYCIRCRPIKTSECLATLKQKSESDITTACLLVINIYCNPSKIVMKLKLSRLHARLFVFVFAYEDRTLYRFDCIRKKIKRELIIRRHHAKILKSKYKHRNCRSTS
jgi:transposase-like protein